MGRITVVQKSRILLAEKVIKIMATNGCNGTKKKEIIKSLEISNKTYVWIMKHLRYSKKELIYCSDKEWYLKEKL